MVECEGMRLDRFLWFVRLAKTRAVAQQLAEAGRMRCDGRLIDRAHATVRVGNVLTFAAADGRVRMVRVDALPARRGPAPEARACYTDLARGEGEGAGETGKAANVSQQAPLH